MKRKISLSALLFNYLFGVILGSLIYSDPKTIAFVGFVNVALGFVRRRVPQGVLMVGVNKEAWTNIILEKFYPDGSWLNEMVDMTPFVENDRIHLAEAGIDPEVLINNTVWPIPIVTRTDGPLSMDLDTLDTVNTVVRNVEAIEASYEKMASVTAGHKLSLQNKSYYLSAYNIGPASHTASSPVLATTGADDGTGRARLTLADVDNLEVKFNLMDYPLQGRILLLHGLHLGDLYQDPAISGTEKAQLMGANNPLGFGTLRSFRVYNWSKPPAYVKATLVKKAFGAAVTSNDTNVVSLAYLKTRMMKCDGTLEAFLTEKSPTERGNILGYQKRFLSYPMGTKGFAALVSVDA